MDEPRKNAYRYLLFWAMLDIRTIEWVAWRWHRILNPWFLRRELRRVRRAGATADWLHNLALFASEDFKGFDEEWFWRDYGWLRNQYPEIGDYRRLFDERLAGLQEGPVGP